MTAPRTVTTRQHKIEQPSRAKFLPGKGSNFVLKILTNAVSKEKASNGKCRIKQVIGGRKSILNQNYAVHLGSVHFRFICTLFLERVGGGDPKRMKELFMNRRDTRMGW